MAEKKVTAASAKKKTAAPAKTAAKKTTAAKAPAGPARKAVARPVTRTASRPAAPRTAAPAPAREARKKIAATSLPTAPAGHAPVVAANGSAAGSVALPAALASAKADRGALFQAFVASEANARQGNAATKNRARVRGGGAKPWKQKGTGRARQGSTRAPHWRHGGVVFGPNGRTYDQRIPEKMRQAAFATAFATHAAAGRVIVFDEIGGLSERPRSREVADWVATIGDTGRALIVTSERSEGHDRAVSNLQGVELRTVGSLRLGDLLRFDTLLVARGTLEALSARAGASQTEGSAT
ncbi:MAG TPA: 50S ribosomal protein L4 [Candidatus Limnocylindria bacterium]|jgi:large subunit ribosomal protein L4